MSIFRCDIKFDVVEGDSFTTTYNKLLSQGFVDKFLNVKVDVATWRKGRSELNREASELLGLEALNLFDEKRLLNGIRAVPNMKLFGMVDTHNKRVREAKRKSFALDSELRELNSGSQNLLEEVLERPDDYDDIYARIDQTPGSLIREDKREQVQALVTKFNSQSAGRVLSLREIVKGKYLIDTEYKENYLHRDNDFPLDEGYMFEETDSNNNFNLPCIR